MAIILAVVAKLGTPRYPDSENHPTDRHVGIAGSSQSPAVSGSPPRQANLLGMASPTKKAAGPSSHVGTGKIVILPPEPSIAGPSPKRKPRKEPVKEPMIVPPGQNLRLLVKFQDRLKARADGAGGIVVRADGEEAIAPLAALVRGERMRFVPGLTVPDAKLEALRERAAMRTGIESADLGGLLEVEVDAPVAREQMIGLAGKFHNLSEIEYAQLESLDQPPPPPATDIAPPTDLLNWSQTYRNATGINVDAIWTSYGVRGDGVRFSDCEYQFNPAHEDLAGGVTLQDGIASMYTEFGSDHGTAALGIVAAAENDYGMTGLAPGATHYFYPELARRINGSTQSRATAVIAALSDSEPGDVVMLEMQTSGPGGATKYVPAEYSQSVWNAVKTGTDSGIIVVAAAGNGGEDLDSTTFSAYMARGDSGAILVGAGNAARERLSFSTYGSRVNLQGRGEAVATLGYGNLAKYGGDANQSYTGSFSGTSSATPVVAGAIVLVQALARESIGRSLTPVEMRQLLIDTGRAQVGGPHIGPLPDVPAAFTELHERFPLDPATPLLITTTSLADAKSGSAYSQTLTASGGVVPYSWSISSGALPMGLTLATNGTLSGTPTATGTFSFTIQVADGAGGTQTQAFALTSTPFDANANSIPDSWEVQYFGGINAPTGAASFDADGDGTTNLQEYLAGTSPTDPASKLQIAITSASPSGAALLFPSVNGRLYSVEYSDTLAEGSWNILPPDNRPGTGDVLEVTDPAMPAKRFYRLRVALP